MANSSYLSFTNIRKCSSFQIERTKQNKLSYKKQNLRIFCLIPPPKKNIYMAVMLKYVNLIKIEIYIFYERFCT